LDISPTGTRPLIALIRNNGDLEILDASQNFAVRRIPCGGSVGRAIESVIWISTSEEKVERCGCEWNGRKITLTKEKTDELPLARLFTAGLDGNVVEWDVERLVPRRTLNTGGGGLWCMTHSTDGKMLAVGCEDGQVRLLNLRKWKVEKTLPFPSGRVLSLAWNGDWLAAGTTESSILIWSVNQGVLLHKINMEIRRQNPTITWTVKFAGDILISGNSIGQVQFWDPKFGVLLGNSFQASTNSTDILTISVHSSGKRIFASAADGRTVEFVATSVDNYKWSMAGKRSNHTHDVRTSVCGWIPCHQSGAWHEVLLTGGVDTNLAIYEPNCGTKNCVRIQSASIPPNFAVATEARLLAAEVGKTIHLWELGNVATRMEGCGEKRERESGEGVRVGKMGKKLLEIGVPGGESVSFVCISSNGKLVLYGTRSALRIYNVNLTRNTVGMDVELDKIKFPKTKFGVAQAAVFSQDSKKLAIAFCQATTVTLVNYKVDMTKASLIEISNTKLSDAVGVNMIVWMKGYIAVHDYRNNVFIIKAGKIQSTLRPDSYVQSMRFISIGKLPTLVLVTADHGIQHIVMGEQTKMKMVTLPEAWMQSAQEIRGIAAIPNSGRLRLWSSDRITQVNLNPKITMEGGEHPMPKNLIQRTDYEQILLLEYIASKEVVLVERPAEVISNALPPAQARKKFGGF
jgi:U3 small nucleolar RNA-associated protein 4